ncbi:MAG: hypothetical protein D6729_08285 [Deltaproteobacteria bacterium]|nr:MAG: hypothetical protein D6729_08285 [Deltaproteobacteria bacterium]
MDDRITQSDPVAKAILELLGRLSATWESVDAEAVTAAEQEALRLLTAAGLVERQFALRLSLIGHPLRIEATLIATGAYGLAEAAGPVVDTGWEVWAAEFRRRKEQEDGAPPRFHCERVGPEQVRLTKDGEIARGDLEQGEAARILNFVCGRGPVFAGRTVRGHGHAEGIQTAPVDSASPVDVRLTNVPELVEALTRAFEDRIRRFGQCIEGMRDRRDKKSADRPGGQEQEAAELPYVFRRESNGYWRIRYDGRSVGLFPDELGFRYLYELLRVSTRSVSAASLWTSAHPTAGSGKVLSASEAAALGLTTDAPAELALDEEGLRNIRSAVDELKAQREVETDPQKAVELSERIERLEAYLEQVTDRSGAPRRLQNKEIKRLADAVRSRIQAAIDKIAKQDQACARHFRQCVETGKKLVYQPVEGVNWTLT